VNAFKLFDKGIEREHQHLILNNAVFWDVTLCGLERTDVPEERIASIIRVARISVLGITLAITNNCTW
jgi:hypothetical protein